jgi:Xaa-Pro aminopeptidase
MKRINELLKYLKANQLDGSLISSVPNITYLTGFTGDSSRLIITPHHCALITDGRYTEQAKRECHKDIEIIKWIDNKRYGIETYSYLAELFEITHLGFEGNILTFAEFEMLRKGLGKLELVPLDSIIESLRMLKDDDEIECLRTACRISDKALELTIPFIKEGMTEMALAAHLEFNLKTNGAGNLSFDTLVLSGSNTSLLHGKPSEKKLEKGDFVLFDFGALYKGYHADISRTFVLGWANEQQKEIYKIIQKAEMEAIKSIRPGISAQVPDQIVREIIPKSYIEYYYPGLGHGVGLQIHEPPFLGQTSVSNFDTNMTVTVEPGIYIPGWGGLRIEDTILVRENSIEYLTNFNRELTVL